jgi:hypothetical protein
MKRVDEKAREQGISSYSLMENAGLAVADAVQAQVIMEVMVQLRQLSLTHLNMKFMWFVLSRSKNLTAMLTVLSNHGTTPLK